MYLKFGHLAEPKKGHKWTNSNHQQAKEKEIRKKKKRKNEKGKEKKGKGNRNNQKMMKEKNKRKYGLERNTFFWKQKQFTHTFFVTLHCSKNERKTLSITHRICLASSTMPQTQWMNDKLLPFPHFFLPFLSPSPSFLPPFLLLPFCCYTKNSPPLTPFFLQFPNSDSKSFFVLLLTLLRPRWMFKKKEKNATWQIKRTPKTARDDFRHSKIAKSFFVVVIFPFS